MARSKELTPGPFVVIVHSEVFESEQLDCEVGQVIHGVHAADFTLVSGRVVSEREAPSVAVATSTVYTGILEGKYAAYQALGRWIEANAYRINGPGREVFHRLPLNDREDERQQEAGPEARRSLGAWFGALGASLRLLVTPGLDLDTLNQSWAPAIPSAFVGESPLWRAAHSV